MATNIAGVSGACYSDAGVSLAIGNKNAVEPYFDTRFDIYNQDPPLAFPAPTRLRSMCERAIFQDTSRTRSTGAAPPPASASTLYYTYPSDRTVGTATQNSPILTDVESTTGITSGEPMVDAAALHSRAPPTIPPPSPVLPARRSRSPPRRAGPKHRDGLTIEWTTSGLPEDISFPNLGGAEGNGEWDCANYWAINHPRGPPAAAVGTALGGVCGTPAQTTVSRYQVYRYEIGVGSRRGRHQRLVGKKRLGEQRPTGSARRHESRRATSRPRAARRFAPRRSGVSGVDTTTGGVDRRNLIVPIINCLAQTALGNIAGAGASSKTPVAAFGRFFMTQPYSALKDGNLYGEITGLASSADNVKIFHLVQLYR